MKIDTATIRRLRDALLQSGRRESAVLSPAFAILTRANLLTNNEREALLRVDPVAETMFLMMAADERNVVEEKQAIRGAIRGLSGGVLQDGTIDVMLERYTEALTRDGREARLQTVAQSLAAVPADAETAFTLAAAVALADNQVAEQERAFIQQVASWFRITPERATSILNQLEEDREQTP